MKTKVHGHALMSTGGGERRGNVYSGNNFSLLKITFFLQFQDQRALMIENFGEKEEECVENA